MKNLLTIAEIIIAGLLIAAILIQAKGTGLGSAWGGTGEFYRSKRGLEKILFILSIVLAFVFLLVSILNALIL